MSDVWGREITEHKCTALPGPHKPKNYLLRAISHHEPITSHVFPDEDEDDGDDGDSRIVLYDIHLNFLTK